MPPAFKVAGILCGRPGCPALVWEYRNASGFWAADILVSKNGYPLLLFMSFNR